MSKQIYTIESAKPSYLRIETEHQSPLINKKEKYMWVGSLRRRAGIVPLPSEAFFNILFNGSYIFLLLHLYIFYFFIQLLGYIFILKILRSALSLRIGVTIGESFIVFVVHVVSLKIHMERTLCLL